MDIEISQLKLKKILVESGFLDEEEFKLVLKKIQGSKVDSCSYLECIPTRNKLKIILDSLSEGVMLLNHQGIIVIFNTAAEEISGYKASEAIGKKYDTIIKLVHEKNPKEADQFIKKVLDTGKPKERSNHTLLINKKNEMVPLVNMGVPIKNSAGKLSGCVVVFRDVIRERDVDQAKTEFVSLASHQLRTPLSTINWYAEMLLDGDAGVVNPEQKKYLDEIYRGNQRMVVLVNDLLNVSRLEMGTFMVDPESINLLEIAEDVLKELAPQIGDKKLNIVKEFTQTLTHYYADPSLMRIIFQNLITNAVKYTPHEGEVRVKIEKRSKDIMIVVADNGFGIPKEQQKNIFNKLFRADNVKERDTEGTGLGLYIIKFMVNRLGGKIWFKSAENKGTSFYITLPFIGMRKKEGVKVLNKPIPRGANLANANK